MPCDFTLDYSYGVCSSSAHWTKKLKRLSDLQEISQIARNDRTLNSDFLLLTVSLVPFGMRTKDPESKPGDMQGPL